MYKSLAYNEGWQLDSPFKATSFLMSRVTVSGTEPRAAASAGVSACIATH